MAPWSDLRELRSASGIKMECLFWTPGSPTLSLWQPYHLRRLNTLSWYQHQRQAMEIQLVDFLVHRALLPFTALQQQARLDSRSKRSRFQRIHGGDKGISHGDNVPFLAAVLCGRRVWWQSGRSRQQSLKRLAHSRRRQQEDTTACCKSSSRSQC